MNEENQTTESENTKENTPEPPSLSPETRKKITYGVIVGALMVISFAAGWFARPVNNGQPSMEDMLKANMQMTPPPATTPVPVTEDALKVINFTGVSAAKKASVMAQFNTELCACGCKMSVAECIIRDLNCPMWKDHVTKFQTALGNGKKPNLTQAQLNRPQGMPPGMAMPSGMQMPNGMQIPSGVQMPQGMQMPQMRKDSSVPSAQSLPKNP